MTPDTSAWSPIGRSGNADIYEIESGALAVVPFDGASDTAVTAAENIQIQLAHLRARGNRAGTVVFMDPVASQTAEGTIYVTQRGREDDDLAPYLYQSTDFGKTFTPIVGNMPFSPINVIREDPARPELLYAGTDLGVYISKDAGAHWDVLGGNLPTVPVTDLQIHERDRVIVIATFGRGVWAMDAAAIK